MSCLNEQTSRQTVLGVRHKHTTAVFDEDQHHTQNSTKKISTWMKYFTIYWLVLQYFTCLWWTYLNGVVWAISILQTSHTLYGPNKKKIKQLSVKNIFQMMLIWQCLFTQVCVCVLFTLCVEWKWVSVSCDDSNVTTHHTSWHNTCVLCPAGEKNIQTG